MEFYSIWPFFAGMAMLLAFASAPVFKLADTPPSFQPQRLTTLDGLRGFLAFAVVFHHSVIYHRFLLDGTWAMPPSRFYVVLGHTAVCLFFMVTGYLFWSRLLAESGRPSWRRLYVGRLFRIGPLYLATVAVVLLVVLAETGLRLNSTPRALLREVGSWLPLGFTSGQDINGYPSTILLLAGVTWTLRSEWLFYLSLPVSALVARVPRLHLPCAVAVLALCLLWTSWFPGPTADNASPALYAALFLSGMTAASLHARGLVLRLPDPVASALVLALLAVVLVLFSTAYQAIPVLLIGTAFFLITSGCTVFGVLTSRPARRLGDVSYGIYILQGLALALLLRPAPLRAAALADPAIHWLLVLASMALLVVVATFAHVLIERPGIAWGRRVANLVSTAPPKRRPTPTPPCGSAAPPPA